MDYHDINDTPECERHTHPSPKHGVCPLLVDISKTAIQNTHFRKTVWTGEELQLTVMCIPPCEDIGLEMHAHVDQFIRVESGTACVKIGNCPRAQQTEEKLCTGEAVLIPAGTWHNVINKGRCPLKLSSIYAPPNHAPKTIHETKEDAMD